MAEFHVLMVGLVLQLILGWIWVCQAKPLDMPGSLFIRQASWFVLLQWMASSFVVVSCQSLHSSSLIFNRWYDSLSIALDTISLNPLFFSFYICATVFYPLQKEEVIVLTLYCIMVLNFGGQCSWISTCKILLHGVHCISCWCNSVGNSLTL